MKALIPYLFFDGNCEQVLRFYEDCLGGKITSLMLMEQAPFPVPDAAKKRVMHAEFRAGELVFMASDGMSVEKRTVRGENVQLSIPCESEEQQTAAFNKLSAGGEVTMELQDTFWGARFGTCTDQFGIHWMFNFDKVPKPA